jgi:translation initiation factor IF-2
MAKSVINLVKELGVKSTAEVLDLLRLVGVDTAAEGFGVMSKVDDETVAKLHSLHSTTPATPSAEVPAVKAKTRPRLMATDEPSGLDIQAAGVKRGGGRDFFGPKKPPPSIDKPPEEEKPAPPKRQPVAASTVSTAAVAPVAPAITPATTVAPAPAPPVKVVAPSPPAIAAAAQPASAVRAVGDAPHSQIKRVRQTPPEKPTRPDLSSGPRIISMPDPHEVQQMRARREAPAPAPHSDTASAGEKKKGVGGKALRDKRKGAADEPGARRKREDGGGEELLGRSQKRIFKVGGKRTEETPTFVHHIKIPGSMTLRDLAKASGRKVSEIVRFLMKELSIMATINYAASVEEIQLIAENFKIAYTVALDQEPEGDLLQFEEVKKENQVSRPPVVTIMGHVDHGKTRLLDTIRKTNVIAGEAGGITQHIGAYQVVKKGKHITFIDTPGHEAFTAMRARGSQVTDVVVLVVAADDGVMPQTIEAINHAKAAGVPIVVAVNKIDKLDANPDKVKSQLAERGLVPEEWGGDTMYTSVSALKGEGIDDLLENILLATELVDPKADPDAPPFGVVIESQVDTGIGVVATVLVKQGTLRKGQFILSGTRVGRIKRMENDRGEEVTVAGPSAPARMIGFSDPPENGDKIYCFMNKKQAQAIADQRMAEARMRATAGATGRMSLEKFFSAAQQAEIKDLNLIVKADVSGSEEALSDALKRIEVDGARCKVVSSGVGQINETDVNLAAASSAVIIGFTVGISLTAKKLAEREHVDVRLYDIIYKVTEDIELAMKGLLAPEYEEKPLGRLEVRAVFKADRSGVVAGGYVLDGVIKRGAKYRLKRGGKGLGGDATLDSLKRFKDDVREVASGYECGLLINVPDATAEEGDILEFYEIVEKARN